MAAATLKVVTANNKEATLPSKVATASNNTVSKTINHTLVNNRKTTLAHLGARILLDRLSMVASSMVRRV